MSSVLPSTEYLTELISYYEKLLSQDPNISPLEPFFNFIEEEKFSTMKKLRKAKEVDIECFYFAKNYRGIK